MKRTLAVSVAWVVACGVFLVLILWLDFDLNFFNWSPRWNRSVAAELAGIVGAALVIGLITRSKWDKVARVVTGLVSLVVLAAGLHAAWPEPTGTNWLDRTAPSPWWYRWGRAAVTATPLLLWAAACARGRAGEARPGAEPADSA